MDSPKESKVLKESKDSMRNTNVVDSLLGQNWTAFGYKSRRSVEVGKNRARSESFNELGKLSRKLKSVNGLNN